jgi:hypothetical protein
MVADPPEEEPAGDLSAEVLPAPQCSGGSDGIPGCPTGCTVHDTTLSSTHWQTSPAGKRPVRSSRNQNPKYRDAERGLCSNEAAVLACRGSSRQKLRVSRAYVVCQEKRAERVTKAVDKCTRAASSGQRPVLGGTRGAHREACFTPTSGNRFSWKASKTCTKATQTAEKGLMHEPSTGARGDCKI